MTARPLILVLLLLLAGCDLESLLADPKVAQREAEAKAIGGACRYGLRNIEDCFALNEKASKAAIFAGWKDMDQYMRENKIDGVEPKGLKPPVPAVSPDEEVVDSAKPDRKSTESKGANEPKGTETKPGAKRKLPDKG